MALKKLQKGLRYNLCVNSIEAPKQFPGPNGQTRYSYKIVFSDKSRDTYLADFVWIEPHQHIFTIGNHTPFQVFKEEPNYDVIVPVQMVMSEYEIQIINPNVLPVTGMLLELLNTSALNLVNAEIACGTIDKTVDDVVVSRYKQIYTELEQFISEKLYEGIN